MSAFQVVRSSSTSCSLKLSMLRVAVGPLTSHCRAWGTEKVLGRSSRAVMRRRLTLSFSSSSSPWKAIFPFAEDGDAAGDAFEVGGDVRGEENGAIRLVDDF